MFEFDSDKSDSNKKKHGISFQEATLLWSDSNRVIIPTKYVDESRYLLIGMLADKVWSAVFTIREENIRIISVRRSRKNEEAIYFGK